MNRIFARRKRVKFSLALVALLILAAPPSFARQPAQRQSSVEQQAHKPGGSCLAVRPIGSHAIRNVMLLGVAGALITHERYAVMDAVNYPARIGQKFHGSDLQTVSSSGTKVVVLNKHYTADDLHSACH
jgi:hypothetical protein